VDRDQEAEEIMRALRCSAIALCVMASPVVAQDRESAERGHALALQLCSGCHVVAFGQRPPAPVMAPTFRDIANRPDMNEVSLQNFLRTPHPIMPMLILSADEMRDVSKFIVSLKER
jgi:mono/diheme cytochrome c family protein